MEQVITALELIRGSENLNTMKTSIRSVVGILMAKVTKENSFDRTQREFHSSEDASYWEIDPNGHVTCFLPTAEGSGWVCTGYSTVDTEFPRLGSVEAVFDALQVFIDGILKEFPSIIERIHPVIQASKRSDLGN